MVVQEDGWRKIAFTLIGPAAGVLSGNAWLQQLSLRKRLTLSRVRSQFAFHPEFS